jgi:DNA primase
MINEESGGGGHVQRSTPTARKSHRRGSSPAPRVTPRITIQDIKERIGPAQVETLCREWLPGGKRQGGWWMARTPWRDDRSPSLGVSLSTGYWRDFGGGDSGDMIDLCQKIHGSTLAETLEAFKEMLGL